jgi:dihydrofolate synthase/folylpolyglutamate synthase
MDLDTFLEKKTLYYDKIDYDCISKSWEIVSQSLNLPYVIHIVGTNGKGSTGRFLASFIDQLGYSVLHYSSPHIIKFNERIWINGSNSSDQELESAHRKLQNLLPWNLLEQLTYFEYTTLLGILLSDGMDYLILEAGLGGEFDATNVVQNNLTVLTTIGLDHQNFLGNTLKEITLTKARSCDNTIIIGYQEELNIKDYVKELFADTRVIVDAFDTIQDLDSYELPNYLKNNLHTVLCVLDYLNLEKKTFELPELFGRFQYREKNIIIDVGHNPLAASVIANELESLQLKVILIYNSYKDKDYKTNLQILKPHITEVQILNIDDDRMEKSEVLKSVLEDLKISNKEFSNKHLSDEQNYLVFGSFLVVEEFLKQI